MKVRWKEDGIEYEHITDLPPLPQPQQSGGGGPLQQPSGEPDYMEMLNTYGPLAILLVAAPFVLAMMKKTKQKKKEDAVSPPVIDKKSKGKNKE